MSIIKIFDGQAVVDVEVNDEFAVLYAEMEHKECLINRKETRRHQSLDKSLEHGFEVRDKSVDIEEEIIKQDKLEKLHNAINDLSVSQQELIHKIYFNEESLTSVAKEYGVDKTSIRDRLKTIYKKLKKIL